MLPIVAYLWGHPLSYRQKKNVYDYKVKWSFYLNQSFTANSFSDRVWVFVSFVCYKLEVWFSSSYTGLLQMCGLLYEHLFNAQKSATYVSFHHKLFCKDISTWSCMMFPRPWFGRGLYKWLIYSWEIIVICTLQFEQSWFSVWKTT